MGNLLDEELARARMLERRREAERLRWRCELVTLRRARRRAKLAAWRSRLTQAG